MQSMQGRWRQIRADTCLSDSHILPSTCRRCLLHRLLKRWRRGTPARRSLLQLLKTQPNQLHVNLVPTPHSYKFLARPHGWVNAVRTCKRGRNSTETCMDIVWQCSIRGFEAAAHTFVVIISILFVHKNTQKHKELTSNERDRQGSLSAYRGPKRRNIRGTIMHVKVHQNTKYKTN